MKLTEVFNTRYKLNRSAKNRVIMESRFWTTVSSPLELLVQFSISLSLTGCRKIIDKRGNQVLQRFKNQPAKHTAKSAQM